MRNSGGLSNRCARYYLIWKYARGERLAGQAASLRQALGCRAMDQTCISRKQQKIAQAAARHEGLPGTVCR
jgi:hypothetical protein